MKAKADSILRSADLRCTKPRLSILRALLEARSPLTRRQIVNFIGSDAPDKVTVYRTLETLIKADVVHVAFLQKRTRHYELAHHCSPRQCHPHFTCTECGRTECLHDSDVPLAQDLPTGFVLRHQRVQLEGLCPACNGTKAEMKGASVA